MDFFIKEDTYIDILNSKGFFYEDIIFNDSDTWKLYIDNYNLSDNILEDTYNHERYIVCSIFPLYDVINLQGLNLIITNNQRQVIKNDYIYDFITTLNQKRTYLYNYVYPCINEHDMYLIYLGRTIKCLDYQYSYIRVTKNGSTYYQTADKHNTLMDEYFKQQKLIEKDGTLYYLGTPWYVHEYLSATDNEYFTTHQQYIKCNDFRLRTSKQAFIIKPNVRFNVVFPSSIEAQKFLDGFYARKFINNLY